jgi:hypothetical protein
VSTGLRNTILGGFAGDAITTGHDNIAIGYRALTTNTVGDANTAVGMHALDQMNPASNADTYNTGLGYNAGYSVTTGTQNTLLGALAGDAITTGSKCCSRRCSRCSTNKCNTKYNNWSIGWK